MDAFIPGEPGNRKAGWALLTCLCVGTFLRAYHFWLPDLWLDEYGTWWVVSGSTWTEVAKRAINFQGQSPFYFLIVKLFTKMFGEGSFQLRLPSVIFGILTLFVAFRLAWQIFRDEDLALVSVGVFSMTEQLIWFSQNARPYALALFLTLLSFLLFQHFLERRRARESMLYALTTALLIYAHFLFAFVLVFHMVFATCKFGFRDLLSKYWLWVFMLIAILCLPLTGQIIHLYGRRQALDWIPHIVQSIQASSLARSFADPWALILATAALLAIGIKPIDLRDAPTRRVLLFLLSWLFIPLVGIWIAATIIGVSFLEPRYILFVYPAVFYLWAWLILHVKRTDWLRWLPTWVFLTATFIFSLVPNLMETGTFRHSENLGWGQAASTLAAAGWPGDMVVFYSAYIEADLLAQRPRDDYLLSFVGWPLMAHLPPNHNFNLVSLPFLQNDRTDPYIETLMLRAAKLDRVWVIGPDRQREYFNDKMISQYGFYPVHRYLSNNQIKVSLLLRSRNRP
jgi:mannosyltransferase